MMWQGSRGYLQNFKSICKKKKKKKKKFNLGDDFLGGVGGGGLDCSQNQS